MRCESFESRLNELLDQRLPLSAADVEEHIRQCSACRDLARAYESVFAGLQRAAVPPEPAGFTRRIVCQARRSNVIRMSGFPRRWHKAGAAVALASAAVLLAAFGLSWILGSAPRLADTQQPRPADIAQRPGPSHEQRPTAKQVNKQVDALVASSMPKATASLDPSRLNADELMRSLPGADWAQGVADGLEPVTKPTVGAISGFLHLWGVGDEGRRS